MSSRSLLLILALIVLIDAFRTGELIHTARKKSNKNTDSVGWVEVVAHYSPRFRLPGKIQIPLTFPEEVGLGQDMDETKMAFQFNNQFLTPYFTIMAGKNAVLEFLTITFVCAGDSITDIKWSTHYSTEDIGGHEPKMLDIQYQWIEYEEQDANMGFYFLFISSMFLFLVVFFLVLIESVPRSEDGSIAPPNNINNNNNNRLISSSLSSPIGSKSTSVLSSNNETQTTGTKRKSNVSGIISAGSLIEPTEISAASHQQQIISGPNSESTKVVTKRLQANSSSQQQNNNYSSSSSQYQPTYVTQYQTDDSATTTTQSNDENEQNNEEENETQQSQPQTQTQEQNFSHQPTPNTNTSGVAFAIPIQPITTRQSEPVDSENKKSD